MKRRRRICMKKKKSQGASHYWLPPVVCTAFAKLDRMLDWWGWVLARSLPLSFTFWTGARVLLGLLYCAGGKLPIRGSLIEHWRQEFYKEADLLFITSHSLSLSPTLLRFPLLTVPHSNFLSWSCLQLSSAVFLYPSLLIPPLVSLGLLWLGWI